MVNKYLRSNKFSFFFSFISMITILGIAIGVTVVIIALSVLDGFDSMISKKIVDFNSHILISGFGEKSLDDKVSIDEKISSFLTKEHSVSKFISKNSIIRSRTKSEGIIVYGIEPDNTNLEIKEMIVEGKYEFGADHKNILVGKKLAQKLNLNVGDKITLFSLKNNQLPSYSNPPIVTQFKVSAIYESGMPEYDDLKAYITMSSAQKLYSMDSKISGYNIKLSDISKIDEITENLRDNFRYPYYIRTIFQQHQNIFTWIELQNKPIPIVLGLIILVAIFNIVGTILMNIVERTRQIGILKSLGATRKQVLNIFLIQGVYLGIIGILLGNILAYVLSDLQLSFNIIKLPETVYFLTSAPIKINIFNYLVVSLIAFCLSILSSIIPSFIASKIRPITAIRFD